ncbi:ABC transporter ATP-binding protein (plasmid) [Clostridium perfringens]|uniref:ABC transporter ATP-binding protein n=1 Tax=Clostridium perfringens TaxID=1502 RepID=UPI000B380C8C|nr:ABC transporter ATP-binding protein [Clostridium perfringens]EGT0690053.1 ABC transporter ATP-binding protein [Clostridium perfringens]EGT0694221.1 ABC transporter ATP-binding protein [Clostridium perfringens]EGT0696842.1 ABC transporter ATP-binding protein [Clostridium perfringens]OUN51169.1 hypothetical protein B5G18_13445 [Clostridium perfringens]OUP43989.1 hypothetical protein B5F20_12920 [Clostridium perfringens]
MLRKKNNISILKAFKVLLPMYIKAAPFKVVMSVILGFLLGFNIFAKAIATQIFFDSATNLSNGTILINSTILAGLFLAFIFILSDILSVTSSVLNSYLFEKTAGYITNFINRKVSKIESINFESSERLDDINKAHQGVMGGIYLISITIMILTTYTVYFVFMGMYLYKLNPILILALFCVFIPVILNQFIRVKIFSKLEDKSANLRREFDYYEKCIIDREYFKETRLLGAFNYFNAKYKTSLKALNKAIWVAEKKVNLLELLMKIITIIGYGIILFLLFTSLMNNKISVGAFGAVLSSIIVMFGITEEIICFKLASIATNFGAVQNLIKFLEIEERTGIDIDLDVAPSVTLENVSFTYPCNEKETLKNINLKVNSKETIAIIGENGSGKTTLMKLILGLYLPTEGDVFLNGNNTKDISFDSIFKNSSAIFQNFKKYKFDLRDNIAISSMNTETDDTKIKECLGKVDIDLNSNNLNLNTMLSKEFGGIDLSGGQWQRIAIARGLYRVNNLIILDEPTAAIDPIEEGEIFKKFREIAKDKTAIIVTHRMGTVKIADRVVVLESGQICEIGTHEEILQKNGKYREMYNAQSKWYELNSQ